MLKTCRGCHKELPINEFYKHSQMMDGHLNYCKECVKNRVNKHREENVERAREYDKKRSHLEKRKASAYKAVKKERENPLYQHCHNKVIRAVENGSLRRPNSCQVCGEFGRIEAHHVDYTKPLAVVWLCPICHRQYHIGKTDRANDVRHAVDAIFSVKIKDEEHKDRVNVSAC